MLVLKNEYELYYHQTMLHAQEALNFETTDQKYQDSLEGWDFGLGKNVAEGI